jgi:hypothetical protein
MTGRWRSTASIIVATTSGAISFARRWEGDVGMAAHVAVDSVVQQQRIQDGGEG